MVSFMIGLVVLWIIECYSCFINSEYSELSKFVYTDTDTDTDTDISKQNIIVFQVFGVVYSV